MALYKSPLSTLIDTINTQNRLSLNLEEYRFSEPVPITPTHTRGDNTELRISSKDLQSTYSGSVVVTYRRLALSEVAHQGNVTIPSKGLQTTRDVYERINQYYGTVFTDDDIVIRSLTEEEMEAPTTISIQAKATSYGWIGSTSVSVREGGYELKDHLVYTKLVGFDYPNNAVSKPFGHIYSYWRDFSGHYDGLIQLTLGKSTANNSILKSALEAVTNEPWVTAGMARYSLQGADVKEIVKPAEENNKNYNVRYDNAIKVELNDSYNLGIGGYLILHFNTPIEYL